MSVQLPSWNAGPTRQAILDFVAQATDAGNAGYVPVEERIAVFDNDGTLWCEKPMYIQLHFILQGLAAMAEQDSTLRDQQPWKAAWERDYAWLGAATVQHYQGDDTGLRTLMGGILKLGAGRTLPELEAASREFVLNTQHPSLGRKYIACGYQPMVELLQYLEAHGFTTLIATGGGRDFMRPIAGDMYGIPRERVIGSSVSVRYQPGEGGGSLVHQAEMDVMTDGPEKPVRIWSRIGRRPILAAGNSNGDIEMLQFSETPGRPALRLLIHHDDAAREFAYDDGSERALQLAEESGWTTVSMRNDWAMVFADDV